MAEPLSRRIYSIVATQVASPNPSPDHTPYFQPCPSYRYPLYSYILLPHTVTSHTNVYRWTGTAVILALFVLCIKLPLLLLLLLLLSAEDAVIAAILARYRCLSCADRCE